MCADEAEDEEEEDLRLTRQPDAHGTRFATPRSEAWYTPVPTLLSHQYSMHILRYWY
jgi:hypothetical protein